VNECLINGTAPCSAIRFTTYETCVYRMKERAALSDAGGATAATLAPADVHARSLSYLQTFMAGTISGALASGPHCSLRTISCVYVLQAWLKL
jgi:hypothetical protein